MTLGGLTLMGSLRHVLDGGQDRTNPFADTRDTQGMTNRTVAFSQITMYTCSLIATVYNNKHHAFSVNYHY